MLAVVECFLAQCGEMGLQAALECIHPAAGKAVVLFQGVWKKWQEKRQRDHCQRILGRFRVRDVTWGEDACRMRSGAAPQVLAAFRNAAVHLLATVPADSNKAAIETLQVNPLLAQQLLGIPIHR